MMFSTSPSRMSARLTTLYSICTGLRCWFTAGSRSSAARTAFSTAVCSAIAFPFAAPRPPRARGADMLHGILLELFQGLRCLHCFRRDSCEHDERGHESPPGCETAPGRFGAANTPALTPASGCVVDMENSLCLYPGACLEAGQKTLPRNLKKSRGPRA